MEKLPQERQVALKKASTDSLKSQLAKTGISEEKLTEMDRNSVLQALIEWELAEKGEIAGASAIPDRKPMDMWERELTLR